MLLLAVALPVADLAAQTKQAGKAKPKVAKAGKVAKAAPVAPVAPVPPAPSVPPAPPVMVYETDLTAISNDQLTIKVLAPRTTQSELVYRLPAMVPGTYHVYNFGRWVSGMQAVSNTGKALPVSRIDNDSWKISNATELAHIIYRVSDSFDSLVKEIPFEPAGSNIQKDTTVLMNTHCFFGYFDGYKDLPVTLRVKRPTGMYGATSMVNSSTANNEDVFKVRDYVELADNPILYTAQPDTISTMVGGARVQISVYDAKGQVNAKDLLPGLQGMLKATSDYFDGKLPTNRYSFLLHYAKGGFLSNSAGALEHNTSSVYTLTSEPGPDAAESLRDIASHEFFHIITPLNIHSEEIGNFDFANPTMSRHLWLYEGQTEYMSSYVLFRQGVKSTTEYLANLKRYISASKRFFNDTLPFTEMSLKVLGETERQYSNVYLKGPLINLCLDIRLRQLSGGTYGLKELVRDLSAKYGKDRSFKDPELFDEITRLSGQPAIREFFTRYVEGKEPLPLVEMLGAVGIQYAPELKSRKLTIGNVALVPNEGRLAVQEIADINEFGKKIGYKVGDLLISLNDVELTPQNGQAILNQWRNTAKVGDQVTIVLERDGKRIKRKAKAMDVEATDAHVLKIDPNADAEKLKLWKSWAGDIPKR